MIPNATHAADVPDAVKANVIISVSRDTELTPVTTRVRWVSRPIILYLLVYISYLTCTCVRGVTEYRSTGPENERPSKWRLHGIIRNERIEKLL